MATGDKLTTLDELKLVYDTINGNVVNNLTTTSAGKMLDARQGKALDDAKLPRDFSGLTEASSVSSSDLLAVDTGSVTKKVAVSALQPTPYVASIPTGQWSGSGSDRYITVQASNVTANSILIPSYDNASQSYLNGPVWCVPAAGSFTIHTTAIPSNTVTIMVQFVGTMGTATYQVLSDVYSKSQTDSLIAQSTAFISVGNVTEGSTYSLTNAIKNSKLVSISFRRYGYCAAITMPTYTLRNGPTAGTYATADGGNRYMTFKCDGDVITILHDGLSSPTMEIVIVN